MLCLHFVSLPEGTPIRGKNIDQRIEKRVKKTLTNTKPDITPANSTHLAIQWRSTSRNFQTILYPLTIICVWDLWAWSHVFVAHFPPPSCQHVCVLCVFTVPLSPQHQRQETTERLWLGWYRYKIVVLDRSRVGVGGGIEDFICWPG